MSQTLRSRHIFRPRRWPQRKHCYMKYRWCAASTLNIFDIYTNRPSSRSARILVSALIRYFLIHLIISAAYRTFKTATVMCSMPWKWTSFSAFAEHVLKRQENIVILFSAVHSASWWRWFCTWMEVVEKGASETNVVELKQKPFLYSRERGNFLRDQRLNCLRRTNVVE